VGAADVDPASPPEVPPGSEPGPPDFVGVGVQKAGTTWWYDLIAAHPAVHHPPGRPKELHFFDRFWGEPFTPADAAAYEQWFARPAGTCAGEWTPRYLHDWWVLPILAAVAPDVRLLVLLRDPIERYRSGVAHELGSRGRRDPAIPGDALRRSCYAAQLDRLLAVVPAERVLVQQFERCVVDPRGQLARTFEFLGLEDVPELDIPGPVNVTEGPQPALPTEVAGTLESVLADDLERLSSMPFDLDLDLWPSAAEVAGQH
jgi:hypothetical protein